MGEIAEIIGGGTPDTNNPEYWDGDIDWYAPAEMEGKRYAIESVRKITKQGLQSSSAKILPAGRTILFTSRAGIGKMAILQRPAATNQGFQSLVLRDGFDPYFIYSEGSIIKSKAEGMASGSTFLEISGKLLASIEISIPSIQEQSAIANFFRLLDDLITLHQRKYSKLLHIKQSMLEKMFPRNGADVPEVRFAGFTDAWEQRKLGDMGTTFTGLSGKTKEDFGHGSGRFVTYMNVYLNAVADPKRVEAVEIDSKQNRVCYGDVFFTTSSETPEEVGMSSVWLDNISNTYLNSFCFGYRPAKVLDPYYMAYMLRSSEVRNKIVVLAQGISRYNISKNAVMDIAVPIPTIDEQQLIGHFLHSLDNLITLHQRKLQKLKQIKQSMLDRMFI